MGLGRCAESLAAACQRCKLAHGSTLSWPATEPGPAATVCNSLPGERAGPGQCTQSWHGSSSQPHCTCQPSVNALLASPPHAGLCRCRLQRRAHHHPLSQAARRHLSTSDGAGPVLDTHHRPAGLAAVPVSSRGCQRTFASERPTPRLPCVRSTLPSWCECVHPCQP